MGKIFQSTDTTMKQDYADIIQQLEQQLFKMRIAVSFVLYLL